MDLTYDFFCHVHQFGFLVLRAFGQTNFLQHKELGPVNLFYLFLVFIGIWIDFKCVKSGVLILSIVDIVIMGD